LFIDRSTDYPVAIQWMAALRLGLQHGEAEALTRLGGVLMLSDA
jgi:hypothetical protein